jgi:hypothetical protein
MLGDIIPNQVKECVWDATKKAPPFKQIQIDLCSVTDIQDIYAQNKWTAFVASVATGLNC